PEVVPEREAVLEEDGALVDVRREVAARWGHPDEQRREGRRSARRCERFPGQRRRAKRHAPNRHTRDAIFPGVSCGALAERPVLEVVAEPGGEERRGACRDAEEDREAGTLHRG